MNRFLSSALVASLTLLSFPAQTNEQLAKEKKCLACHGIDNKIVGPAYKDVAKKYAGQAGAEEQLVEKVINGGGGVWGQMPMPPNPQVSAEEAKRLVEWILSLK